MATNRELWAIVFYQDGKGKRPVQEFLDEKIDKTPKRELELAAKHLKEVLAKEE